ncbi:MAG: pilus assembly protein PilM [Planctomycetota bacterium]|jgi:Tfp pilus assembly protein PilN
MKLGTRTALGVDISEGQINLALLKQSAKGIRLVKAASGPVPDGAIENGCIADSAALARAIRDLRNRNRIRARRAAVSLSVSPVITNILEIPEGSPSDISRFIRDELKSYVALSGREITFDSCRIRSGQGSGGQLLAVAADDEEVTELTRTCIRAGLNVEAVEPVMLAYVRALYAEKIEGRFDCSVLIGLLQDNNLTLCVFRKETLDLVRVEDISAERAEPAELCRRLAREINAIIQFYEVEVPDSGSKWEVTVFGDRVQLPADAEDFLRAETSSAYLDVRSGTDAFQDMVVEQKARQERPSALAVSLAMGLLNMSETGLRLNLVTPESAEVRSVKKQLILTTVVVVLVIPLLAFLAGKGLGMLADEVHKRIDSKKRTDMSQDTSVLLEEQESLERKIALLSERNGLKAILESRKTVDWASILDEVKDCTPKEVRITALYNKGETEMGLEGLAFTYRDARLFVEALNAKEHIGLATLSEATRDDAAGGLVTYTIDCTITNGKSES